MTEGVFEKKFQVRERIPLSALVPAHMAAPLPGEAARAPVGWPTFARPPRWPKVRGLNDCHDKEATSRDTSEGRSPPVVVHRHGDARKQAQ
jgi:hypothetical protein